MNLIDSKYQIKTQYQIKCHQDPNSPHQQEPELRAMSQFPHYFHLSTLQLQMMILLTMRRKISEVLSSAMMSAIPSCVALSTKSIFQTDHKSS